MIRKMVFLAGAAALASASPALAQEAAANTDSDTAQGSVVIEAPIAIAKAEDLNFGIVARPRLASDSSTITLLASTGAVSASGSGFVVDADLATAAEFNVTGEVGRSFGIDLSELALKLAGEEDIVVTLDAPENGTIATEGTSFKVGGSFSINGATPTGQYSGEFTATVTYE